MTDERLSASDESKESDSTTPHDAETTPSDSPATDPSTAPREYGGPKGPEPTRYGDWEKNGRCIDF